MPPAGPASPGNGAGRSADARGKAVAMASVSMTRRIPRPSLASGRVASQPCSCRQVAGWVSSSTEAAVARTCATASSSSARVGACTHRYRPTLNSLAWPRAIRSASSAASSAAASVIGSASRPFSASPRRLDSNRARCRRSRAAATCGASGSM